jgi:flagellar biosynthesis protein FlhF
MNVRRFTARTSRDALVLVRQALGDDAVVLSTKPCADGVEVLAMAPEGMQQIERMASQPAPAPAAPPTPRAGAGKTLSERSAARAEAMQATMPGSAQPKAAAPGAGVNEDVAKLSMSTLSFQDYVRERMLKRRQVALNAEASAKTAPARTSAEATAERGSVLEQRMADRPPSAGAREPHASTIAVREPQQTPAATAHAYRESPVPRSPAPQAPAFDMGDDLADDSIVLQHADRAAAQRAVHAQAMPHHDQRDVRDQRDARDLRDAADNGEMLAELRQVRGLIEERFGALAFMEKLGRSPKQALLTQRLLDCGYSPALIRKIGDSLPAEATDEIAWAAGILERNLATAEGESPLEDQGGVYALVGATGVGKTTTTAKIAAAFATKYGAANLGLITLDAYRIGAHEQLRAYGRILGVPVHTAHDRASLEDLLELLAGKKMVLIDTAGMAQRDSRTRELLDMLSHRSVQKLLVVNAASQGETIEDVMVAYRAPLCAGVVLSKMDEAVKLGPALDALIRNKLKLVGVANGQRVPEDWHRLTASALVQRSLRNAGSSAYKLDASDVSLIFTAPIGHPVQRAGVHA